MLTEALLLNSKDELGIEASIEEDFFEESKLSLNKMHNTYFYSQKSYFCFGH